MKQLNDYYAVTSDDIDAAALSISRALGVTLEEEEWSKRGRYFAHEGENDVEFVLMWNWNEHFEEWNKLRFKRHPLILMLTNVDETQSKEAERRLKEMDDVSVTLLERGFFDPEIEDYRFLFRIEESESSAP